MKIIIIEDEKPSARRLQRLLLEQNLEVEVLLHSVEESIHWFNNNEHPELIFLDIQLSDGLSFEIFEAVHIKSPIIFTTAYDEYALQAFKHNSIDYLLKPIDEDELNAAIAKFKERIAESESTTLDLDAVRNLLIKPKESHFKKRFSIKVGQHLKLVSTSDIECIYSENKGTYLYTNKGRNYLIDLTLDELNTSLDPDVFFRINRKYYINIEAINDMVTYTNSRLQIKLHSYSENEIIVARERVKAFKKWLE